MQQQIMKKQSGFTLIELVIVIIILGILAATAVPKFINLQGDARGATLEGVKGALESAASLTYAQAAIQGIEKSSAAVATTRDKINTKFGFPTTTKTGIEAVVELNAGDWTFAHTAGSTTTAGSTVISVSGSVATDCNVTYNEAADANTRPVITVKKTGC